MGTQSPGKIPLFTSLIIAVCLLLGGCVSRPKEQASPGELLILGQEDLKAERFESAREAFKRLLREYPDSKHRREGLLNLADSYYKEEEYIEARVQYSEYVQLYPVSPQTPKAYYFLGMSDYHRSLEFDRDQEITHESLKSFDTLLKRFPRSEFAKDARNKKEELRRRLAQHSLFIARFYMRRGARVSAIPRLKEMLKEFREFPDIRAEAMLRLGESFALEQSYRNAANAFRNLVTEYPDSPHAQEAYQRLLRLAEKK